MLTLMKSLKRKAVEEADHDMERTTRTTFCTPTFDNVIPTPPSPALSSPCTCQSSRGLERIFSLSPVPTIVLDKDLRITCLSTSLKARDGLAGEVWQHRDFGDLCKKLLLPANHATVIQTVQDALKAREERKTEPLPDREPDRWLRLRVIPIYEGDDLLYMIIEGQDATQEVEKRERYSRQYSSAETYQILVSALREYAIFMLDTQGNIATWNQAARILKQYDESEIIGKHFSIFYSDADRKARKPEKELEIALREGKVEDEGWRVRKDGSRFWANVVIAPVFREGVLTGFSKVTRDLTERKGTEARMISAYEEASKMKSDFLANMSHEIRTPMHGMLSALSLLIDTGLTAEQKELADIIDESGSILLQVINDILDYSKLTSGSFSITKEDTNIREIVAAVRRCFKLSSKPDLKFEVDMDPRLPTLAQGDPLRYRQVLQNLVSNAIKFTEHGSIRVSVQLTEQAENIYHVKTEVIDTGIGVPAELENVLFTPFTQLDNFTTKRYKGTGLGLSICKSLAELMGGTVGYRPNPEGSGSIFYFTAELGRQDGTSTAPTVAPILDLNIKQVARTKQLLLVEDNAINQTIMVRLLRGFGFEKVDVACDGSEGLRLVSQKPLAYHLILMDISMPVMDGVAATKAIRALGHSTPIIAMTANALKGDEEAYLAEGMNDYIAKPVDRRLLVSALMRWLR